MQNTSNSLVANPKPQTNQTCKNSLTKLDNMKVSCLTLLIGDSLSFEGQNIAILQVDCVIWILKLVMFVFFMILTNGW
jgi:hypothetical protein